MRTGRPSSAPRSLLSPSVPQIAWAAGFYEGDGTCTKVKNNRGRKFSQTAKISQVEIEPLLKMQALFGGSITSEIARGFSRRVQYIWQVSGARARGFLYTIFSFLSARRRMQARAALGV